MGVDAKRPPMRRRAGPAGRGRAVRLTPGDGRRHPAHRARGRPIHLPDPRTASTNVDGCVGRGARRPRRPLASDWTPRARRRRADGVASNGRGVLLGIAPGVTKRSRRGRRGDLAGTPRRGRRYGCQSGSIGPAERSATWWRAARPVPRRSTMPHSAGSRSSLRALHGRHDATTFSQVCVPAARAGHDVVEVLGVAAAVLAAVVVAGEHRPPRQRRRGAERHADEVHEPDHRRAPGPRGARSGTRRRCGGRSRPSPSARARPRGGTTRRTAVRSWR